MPKTLLCADCGTLVGEVEKGRIRKGATHRCPKCEEAFKQMVMGMKMQMSGGINDYTGAINDAIRNMFGGKS